MLFQIEQLTHRELMWLGNKLLSPSEYTSTEQIRAALIFYVQISDINSDNADTEYRQIRYYLLPDAELEWIERSDLRLLRWIFHYLHSNYETEPATLRLSMYLPDTSKYEHLVQNLDLWEKPVSAKREALERAKQQWSEILSQDKKLKWLEPQNKTQIEWAWGYIKERKIMNAPVRSATTTSEMYIGVLEIFDCWRNHPAELKDFRETMKRAWAQHKYRLNLNGKKQSTFVLSIEAKDKLQKLAKAQNINMNQMLEHIISKEFAHEGLGKKR